MTRRSRGELRSGGGRTGLLRCFFQREVWTLGWIACALANPLGAQPPAPPVATPALRFQRENLPCQHEQGDSGRRYLVETMGSGLALLDVDGDHDLDLYLANGLPLPGCDRPGRPGWLLRNDGRGQFTDATSGSGLEAPCYGMGCAVGDIDADHDPDLYLTCFGANRLYRNDGGTFTDITATAGVGDEAWGASAAFADLDRDGDLDLYVTNYLDFTIEKHKECTLGSGKPAYCSPDAYPGAADVAYRNEGGGRFTRATAEWGLTHAEGKSLGVVCGDFDRDGRIDIYLAKDGVANTLWRGAGAGRFQDATLLAGVGYSEDGMAQAGMGIAAGDLFGDGRTCLFVTNLSSESNVLYREVGGGVFIDATATAGLKAPSLRFTGFGALAGDFDEDGDLDLFVANGHVIDNIREFYDYLSYEQPNHLYRNDGGVFREVSSACFLGDVPPAAGRGAALGDLDGDGDLDVVVSNCGARPTVYRNLRRDPGAAAAGGQGAGWLLIELTGRRSAPDGMGAIVTARAAGRQVVRERHGGGSYLSASDGRVHLALPGVACFDEVEILWPSGARQRLADVPAGKELRVMEPEADAAAPAGDPAKRP